MQASALIRAVISRGLCRSLLKGVAKVYVAVLCSAKIVLNTTQGFLQAVLAVKKH